MSAAPAQADTSTDVFLGALDHYRLGDIDPATAVRVGESSVRCWPNPGRTWPTSPPASPTRLGQPLGPATMFTGLAIQILCPRAVTALTDGVPFSFF